MSLIKKIKNNILLKKSITLLKSNNLSKEEREELIKVICESNKYVLKMSILKERADNLYVHEDNKIIESMLTCDNVKILEDLLINYNMPGTLQIMYLTKILNTIHPYDKFYYVLIDNADILCFEARNLLVEHILSLTRDSYLINLLKKIEFIEYYEEIIGKIKDKVALGNLFLNEKIMLNNYHKRIIIDRISDSKSELKKAIDNTKQEWALYNYALNYYTDLDLTKEELQNISIIDLYDKVVEKIIKQAFMKFEIAELQAFYLSNFDYLSSRNKKIFVLEALVKDDKDLYELIIDDVVDDNIANYIYDRMKTKENDIINAKFTLLNSKNKIDYINRFKSNPDLIIKFLSEHNNELTKNEQDLVINNVCEYDIYRIILSLILSDNIKLSSNNYTKLVDAIKNAPSNKIHLAIKSNNLNQNQVEVLAKEIIERGTYREKCDVLINVKNLKKNTKQILKDQIFASKEIKYITYLIVYINDEQLIKKYFESQEALYMFITTSDEFTNDDKEELIRELNYDIDLLKEQVSNKMTMQIK